MSKQPVGGVPGFKIVVTCVFIDEHGDGTPCWTAMVDRFPDVRGYSESPVEAVTIAAEAAAELWFNEKDRPSDQPDAWRPIETAPKTRQAILVANGGWMITAHWHPSGCWATCGPTYEPIPARELPTHWMPLPDPPTDQTTEEQGK